MSTRAGKKPAPLLKGAETPTGAGGLPETALGAEERLRLRIAWAYYVEGQTQSEVAAQFSLNRVRVNRILSAARESGMVQISIDAPGAAFIALERELEKAFGLKEVVIVPAPHSGSPLYVSIAAAAGAHFSKMLRDDISVGIAWGRTLRLSLQSMPHRKLENLSVVSLIGGLTRASIMNAYETASRLAERYRADCFYIAAPVFADDAATRDILLQQTMIRDVMDRTRALDCALVSVGGLGPNSTIEQLGLVSPEERDSLLAAGAAGDLLGYYIDEWGTVVDHPLNRRVVAANPEALRPVPSVVLASGGVDKDRVILGALRGKYCDHLITDDATGQRLLAAVGRTPETSG